MKEKLWYENSLTESELKRLQQLQNLRNGVKVNLFK